MKTLQDFKEYLDAVVYLGRLMTLKIDMDGNIGLNAESVVEAVNEFKEVGNANSKTKNG